MYDLTSLSSMTQLEAWYGELQNYFDLSHTANFVFPIVVVGSKNDLVSPSHPLYQREEGDDDSERKTTQQEGGRGGEEEDNEEEKLAQMYHDILNWCRERGLGHVTASAKDGSGVIAAVEAIAALALENAHHQVLMEQERERTGVQSERKHLNHRSIDQMYNDNQRNCC